MRLSRTSGVVRRLIARPPCLYSDPSGFSDYPRCLREWGRCVAIFTLEISFLTLHLTRRRLEENWSPKLVASLQERYPSLKEEHNMDILRRRWRYMYLYMEVAYSRAWLSLGTWTFVRPVSALFLCCERMGADGQRRGIRRSCAHE